MQLSIKYRPTRFAEVEGQTAIKRILVNSIKRNKVPAALLLHGVYGCGKTTLARIYAQALNCEALTVHGEPCGACEACRGAGKDSAYIIEFDAASHSGVEDVRKFEEFLRFKKQGKYLVIILDECHMLSKSAQAALLKLIEEPTQDTLFILVTTDAQRLDETVRSRCLNLTLKPLTYAETYSNLSSLIQKEGRTAEASFVHELTMACNGSLRESQQLLESLLLSFEDHLTVELLQDALNLIPSNVYKDLAHALNTRSYAVWHEVIEHWVQSGVDLNLLYFDSTPKLLRDFSLCIVGLPAGVILYSGINPDVLSKNLVLTFEDIKYITKQWEVYAELMQHTSQPKIMWGVFAVSVCV